MSMRNNGFEVELGVKIINTNNFKWNIDANITKYKNTVTKLAKGKDPQWLLYRFMVEKRRWQSV